MADKPEILPTSEVSHFRPGNFASNSLEKGVRQMPRGDRARDRSPHSGSEAGQVSRRLMGLVQL